MKRLVETLIQILQTEAQLLRSLIEQLRSERATILSHDAHQLERSTEQKQQLLRAVTDIEARRENVLCQLGRKLGVSNEDPPSLTSLMEHLGEPAAGRLSACRSALKQLAAELARVNRTNHLLLRNGLGFVRQSLKLLEHLLVPQTEYRRSGRLQRCAPGGRLIRKTA